VIVHTPLGAVGVDEAGTGAPLLLLHGFPLDRTLWAPQLAAPAPGIQYLAPDLPGCGESVACADPSFDAWADWVAGLLDTLRIERAMIGGFSMGGYLAFALWRRHPQRVRALVLADTRAGADDDAGRAKRRAMQGLALAEGPGAIAEQMIPGMVGRTSRETRPKVVGSLEAMMRRASVGGITDCLQAMIDREDSAPTLATITVPTLIICGEEDALTPAAESRAMQAAIPGSRLALVPGAGHASNFEAPEVFNALLSEFLTATIRLTNS
jgi:3-oxoadipate enol-lactonase